MVAEANAPSSSQHAEAGSSRLTRSRPPARKLAYRTISLPSLGGMLHDAPQRPAEVRRGPNTRSDIAHPAGSGSTSSGVKTAARHSVPTRPSNFHPVPSQPPGPATVGRTQQVRAPPPQPRPSAAKKQARPDTQPASAVAPPAPSDAVPPRSDAPPARSAALPARPTAQPARPDGPATHQDAPSPHPAGSAPAAATPAHPMLCYKRTVTPQRLWFASNFSPPPPRTSARDSLAAMPGTLSRSGSEMSVASGEYSPIRDQSPPHLEDASDQEDEEGVEPGTQPERAQRRQRNPDDDDDAAAEGEYPKRYCVQAPQPSFAEMARRTTPPRDTAAATATATAAAPPKKKSRYPPLVVEKMPDWAAHFRFVAGGGASHVASSYGEIGARRDAARAGGVRGAGRGGSSVDSESVRRWRRPDLIC
ncbi:hypothetical protein B5X24_HaOG216109 [Helicoverpa armigera]|uniref:Uncharacterized protein n=1 Tax=Helicoverpa armigera TaxID=29058 RepID=A0A2W1B6L4_HELAM|nr:hypothetical protein B5X24_HaOG216109 [Helicoverpa armigera]